MHIRHLGQQDYTLVWDAMRQFTDQRNSDTPDELWIVEHPPVFTLGQAGRPEHILNPHDIPVIRSDRGGQVTYHGPGQLVIYILLDLRQSESGKGIRTLVCNIEKAIINFLAAYHIQGHCRAGAPGVYVKDKKIASIGLRVRRGCTYHGLSFNLDMDITPFTYINPCGYQDLQITQLVDYVKEYQRAQVEEQLISCLITQFNG